MNQQFAIVLGRLSYKVLLNCFCFVCVPCMQAKICVGQRRVRCLSCYFLNEKQKNLMHQRISNRYWKSGKKNWTDAIVFSYELPNTINRYFLDRRLHCLPNTTHAFEPYRSWPCGQHSMKSSVCIVFWRQLNFTVRVSVWTWCVCVGLCVSCIIYLVVAILA